MVYCKSKKPASQSAENPAENVVDQQLADMRELLPDNQVERTNDGIRIVFNSEILFETNSSILSATARTSVLKLANIINEQDGIKSILIIGYKDATGTSEYNIWLSERRASAGKDYLNSQQVRGSIKIRGYGSENPVAENKTPQGRALNRRVEVILLNQ